MPQLRESKDCLQALPSTAVSTKLNVSSVDGLSSILLSTDAEPLGRWPKGKAMKASVATAETLVLRRSIACNSEYSYTSENSLLNVDFVSIKNDSMYNQPSKSFECVGAWQKAHAFTLLVYRLTREFPKDEIFGLTSQFRRAAVSIEANFAEGYKKISKADKLRFFNISEGSLAECHNYIILAKDLGYVDEKQHELLLASLKEASSLLTSYCKGIINNNGIQDNFPDS